MYKTTVKIEGMMCGMCEAHVNDAVRKTIPEAKKVASSRSKGETTFETKEPVDEGLLKTAIEETGYKFISLESEKIEKRGFFGKRG